MRHGKKDNHLGRKKAHRDAMLANMASSLIQHKRIKTTLAKAKVLRQYIEPLLTKSKLNTTHSRRVVFSYLQNKTVVDMLFNEVAAKIANRPGGYVRVIRAGFRPSDSAEVAYIELVDFNEDALQSETAKRKRTRRGRGKKKETNQEQKPAAENTSSEEKSENPEA